MLKRKLKEKIAMLLTVAMVLTMVSIAGGNTKEDNMQAKADTTDLATFDNLNQSTIVANMGAGWDLGNQLEAVNNAIPTECAWGNPTITNETFKMVKAAGFTTVRIPVSYFSHIGSAPDYTVDADWMKRIGEVVDMAMSNGLYVIINMHGDGYTTIDGSWLLCAASDEKQVAIKAKYKAVWNQVATKFANYDEHLIFESMNEEFNGSYSEPVKKQYKNINAYNQIFVDTVRQSGGNNSKRWLLLPGWNTTIDYTVGDYGFEIPTDTYLSSEVPSGEKRIMISVHYYDPYDFSLNETTKATQWGKYANENKVAMWGDETYLNTQFKKVYDSYVTKGYPVVIGEYGTIDKTKDDANNKLYRAYYAKCVCISAIKYGCVPIIWDNGYNGDYGLGLFDRNTYKQTQPEIINAIMQAFAGDTTAVVTKAAVSTNHVTKLKKQKTAVQVVKGKKASVTIKVTAKDNTKVTTDKIKVSFKNKKIASCVTKTKKVGKLVIKVKGLKNGKTVMTVKAGSKKIKLKVYVSNN